VVEHCDVAGAYSDENSCESDCRDFGGRSRGGRFATPAEFPSTRYLVLTCTRTPRKFGIRPLFKDHSLSRRAQP
jgi:hypothetical protein